MKLVSFENNYSETVAAFQKKKKMMNYMQK